MARLDSTPERSIVLEVVRFVPFAAVIAWLAAASYAITYFLSN